MRSREGILAAVLQNQPPASGLPDTSIFRGENGNLLQTYMDVFMGIGGVAIIVDDLSNVKEFINERFDKSKRMVTTIPELKDFAEMVSDSSDPHTYEDVELAIIRAHFCVAENGAVWISDQVMGQRIIPYICQHLAVIVQERDIVPTLHEAYDRIGADDFGFSGFIGGPSKTADIEQALVLGAHGPLTMTVFVIK